MRVKNHEQLTSVKRSGSALHKQRNAHLIEMSGPNDIKGSRKFAFRINLTVLQSKYPESSHFEMCCRYKTEHL
jgi:hypothetical protein